MNPLTDKTYLFEQMPVAQAVRRQILPSIASQMVLLLYNLADTYFVGLLNDPSQTAAVSVAYTVTVLMTAIANLFAVGGASCMARAMGRHDGDGVRRISAISFWWCLLSAALFSGVFALLASPLLHLCGATAGTYALAFRYAKWVVIWGGEGAGLATAISNGVGTLFLLLCIFCRRRSSMITLRPHGLRYTAKYMGDILKIGFPSCVQYLLTVVAVGALMKFMSAYDTEAVAALGIVKKLDMLPLYFSIGVSGGILPLLAYNYASGNKERRRQIFKLGCGISVALSLLCVLLYELLAPTLVGMFIDTPATIAYGAAFLRIMVLAMPMMAVCYPMITQFQAMGRAKESLICSVLRKGALDIPLLFLLDGLLPMYGCTMVQPIVDCLSMLAALWFYRRITREDNAASY